MNSIWLLPLLPFGIAIGFILIWCFAVWLISIFSGWQRLAQRYHAPQPATGKVWAGQYGFVNGARYGNALNVTTNDAGFFLEVVPIFKLSHPRLFIPWHDLHNPTPTVFRWRPLVRVEVGSPPVATLRLPREILEQSEGRTLLEQLQIGTNVPAYNQ